MREHSCSSDSLSCSVPLTSLFFSLFRTPQSGHTADKVASMAKHTNIAELLYNLRQGNLRDHYVDELALGAIPLDRVKLNICGASRVGKSVLIESLRTGFLRSIFRKKPPDEFADHTPFRTLGISVKPVSVGVISFFIYLFQKIWGSML